MHPERYGVNGLPLSGRRQFGNGFGQILHEVQYAHRWRGSEWRTPAVG